MSEMPRDPVCGMRVDPATALALSREGRVVYFCSDFCRRAFLVGAPEQMVAREPSTRQRIAYFSMEIALDPRMPTYAGGLGVLAGDMLRSCADLRVPAVGVTLVSRTGYFRQQLAPDGRQLERPDAWSPEDLLVPTKADVTVEIEGRRVRVQVWTYLIVGCGGYAVPVLLLDTDVPENEPRDRRFTDALYGGDEELRLAQEIVLGVGGVRALEALGYTGIHTLHLNEGHAALAPLELLRRERHDRGAAAWGFDAVRRRCVFTTHTSVPAGHDRFPYPLVERLLGEPIPHDGLAMLAGADALDMTTLALNLSRSVNGVARRHGEVTRRMFPLSDVGAITNGVHSVTWTADSFRRLYDRHVPGWREDPSMLRKATGLPPRDIVAAHAAAKRDLLDVVRARAGRELRADLLTIGFARRSTAYKRPTLIFSDLARLRSVGANRLQLVFAGKAHPRDGGGKDLIAEVIAHGRALGDDLPVVFLPNYDLEMAGKIVAGVDLWLNTPRPPLEASGTSGMKAAHNGVPSLSVLDGWWLEGWVEGVTGWAISGSERGEGRPDAEDAGDLYRKLEETIVPTFYERRERWTAIMQHAIALNASYFNSHRVVQQYVTNAYLG